MKRIAAYVLNMTPQWRPDWGGALLFSDRPGHISEGYLPAFNALNLFSVPQEHLVEPGVALCRARTVFPSPAGSNRAEHGGFAGLGTRLVGWIFGAQSL